MRDSEDGLFPPDYPADQVRSPGIRWGPLLASVFGVLVALVALMALLK